MKSFKHSSVIFLFVIFLFSNAVNAQNRDLPFPTPNINLMPAGSLVIAMDNTNQSNPGYFNLKAYGLIITLLNRNVNLKWVIASGKAHDAIDFSVNAERLYPTFVASSLRDFKAGPFVIYATDTSGIRSFINTFNNAQTASNRVNIYRTTSPVNVDIRYEMLGNIPKAAILNDGGKAAIQEGFMTNAGIPTTNYAIVSTATNLFANCFTFASEPHNDGGNGSINSIIDSIRKFVTVQGGNFLAECHSIPTYENAFNGRFQSSLGINGNTNTSLSNNVFYSNADLSMGQFEGYYDPNQTGHTQTFFRTAGSNATNNFYPIIRGNTNALDSVFGASVSKFKAGNGGLVFYLGNHDFNGNRIEILNGQRMYLNAFLTPAAYPSCPTLGPLEIKLTSFYGKKIAELQKVQLFWATTKEINTKKFIIERSTDGINFSEIANLLPTGTSNSEVKYSTFDNTPVTGKNYYRLVEVEFSGLRSYSNIIAINFSSTKQDIEVYPNPVKDFAVINFNNLPINNNSLYIFDATGRQVLAKRNIFGNNVRLDLSNLNAGMYIVRIITEEGTVVENKLIVAKK